MEKLNIYNNFKDWKLNSSVRGQVEFWDMMMSYFDNETYFLLTFGHLSRDNERGAGGFLEINKQNFINTISLYDIDFDEESKTVTFKSDVEFAYFVHESSHFLHLIVDKGKPMCPLFGVNKIEDARACEYEAGWRSVFYDLYYKMFEGNRVILNTNLENLMNYDLRKSNHESAKELRERIKPLTKDESKAILREVINKVKKISEWFDINHGF